MHLYHGLVVFLYWFSDCNVRKQELADFTLHLVTLRVQGKYPWSDIISLSPGPRLVNVSNASETSTLMVDPVVQSQAANAYSSIPRFSSDAAKVACKGPGLSKAYMGQKASFSVDCSKAGKMQPSHNPQCETENHRAPT